MAKLRKRGDIWWYSFSVAGERIRKSARTADRQLAAEIASNEEERRRRGDRFGPKELITFAEAVILYRQAGKPDRFLLPLLERLKDTRLADISPALLKRVAGELYPGRKPATLNRQAINPASAVINHAAELGHAAAIRARRFKVAKVRRPAGDWKWIRAFEKAALSDGLPGLAALAIIMFTTGARITQACRLTWADVDLAAGTILLPPAKGFPARQAVLVPEALAAIGRLSAPGIEGWRKVCGYNSRHSATPRWNAVIARHGLARRTPHEAGRHGFGTQMVVRGGVDAVTAAEAGGWANPRVLTETYAHAERTAAAVRAAFRKKT